MVSLDHPVVLSLLFKPRYLGVGDAGRLELVSRRFRDFSWRYKQNLTRFCLKQVLQKCARPDVFLSTMPDHYCNLTALEMVEPVWLETMSKLPRLAAMHMTRLTLNSESLVMMNSLTNLRSLAMSEVHSEQDLDVEQFCADSQPQIKLNLIALTFLHFQGLSLLSVCRLELLVALGLQLPASADELETVCQKLRRCVSLKTLIVVNQPLRKFELLPLFSAVAALPELRDFRINGQVELPRWSDMDMFWADAHFYHNLTNLSVVEEATGGAVEWHLGRKTFPNLRRVFCSGQIASFARIFEVQSALETMDWMSGKVGFATEFGVATCWVRSRVIRFVFCFILSKHDIFD